MINNPRPNLPQQEYHPGYTLAEMATVLAAAWLQVTEKDQFNDRGKMANMYALKQAKHLMALLQKDSLEKYAQDDRNEKLKIELLGKTIPDLKIIDELLCLTLTSIKCNPDDLYAYSSIHSMAMRRLHEAYNNGEITTITKSLADHFSVLNIRNQGAEYKHL